MKKKVYKLSEKDKTEINRRMDEEDTKKRAGLYGKYIVRRADGSDKPGGKHHGCQYFVLDLTHDRYALPALATYASLCQNEFPFLARDLRDHVFRATEIGMERLRDEIPLRFPVRELPARGKRGKVRT